MKRANVIKTLSGVLILLYSYGNISDSFGQQASKTTTKPVQTKTQSGQTKSKSPQTKTKSTGTKSTQTKSKSTQKVTKPVAEVKKTDDGSITIGTQKWAVANLNVGTFRNGDSIPEAKTYKEWVAAGDAGKPAWCYYNNDPRNGPKFGRLYNWYAVNDPRGLAPAGWVLSSDTDWTKLVNFLGGQAAAGIKMKSLNGWIEGYNGENQSGFAGQPGGYRIENGLFKNLGSIAIWWSSTESKSLTAYDRYITQSGSLDQSSSPKQRGESVRCLKE